MSLADLSNDHCVLLACHFASESNIEALRTVVATRRAAFSLDLILQILLTYLPESADPSLHVPFVEDVIAGRVEENHASAAVDTSTVKDLSNSRAHKVLQHQHFLSLESSSCPPEEDVLTRFLICRAHKLDDAGLLAVVPSLAEQFLGKSEYLRTWFVSNVLPLLRFGFEYYPEEQSAYTLERSETARGTKAVEMWLSKSLDNHAHRASTQSRNSDQEESDGILARDMKNLVGPWMYGYNQRKRRRLETTARRPSKVGANVNELQHSKSAPPNEGETQHDWECAFTWLTHTAVEHFDVVGGVIDRWNGPSDVDFGGFLDDGDVPRDKHLDDRFAQTVYASIYATSDSTQDAISNAHTALARIARLQELEAPSGLSVEPEKLPRVSAKGSIADDLPTSTLEPDALLKQGHPLTSPSQDTFSLLQGFISSAFVLAALGHQTSILKATKIRFQNDSTEQLSILTKILHTLSTGLKKEEREWANIRQLVLWLWGWGVQAPKSYPSLGYGVFGKVARSEVEKELLKTMISTACFPLIIKIYIKDSNSGLSPEQVEEIVISSALHLYDNASNGNRTRGAMKKASDMVSALKPFFPKSQTFRQVEALFSATHSLSFYSLTLHQGVPFQPVNIRVTRDPIALIEKVLAQNPRSYTHLDDFVSIGVNLVAATPLEHRAENDSSLLPDPKHMELEKRKAERRVIGMAIEASLNEDDFETAYSYVVNRLDTSGGSVHGASSPSHYHDDISWRAALAAGRHKSSSFVSASASLSTPPVVRRLEQRMELLSQALLLAPSTALPEVLSAWRKCEEEMSVLLAQETQDDEAFNDSADRRLPGTFVNTSALIQPRREVGRGVTEEAPMGLFDLARGAAGAISRTAFPLGQSVAKSPSQASFGRSASITSADMTGSEEWDQPNRARKRDMIAGAASGALASGLGWVLGE